MVGTLFKRCWLPAPGRQPALRATGRRAALGVMHSPPRRASRCTLVQAYRAKEVGKEEFKRPILSIPCPNTPKHTRWHEPGPHSAPVTQLCACLMHHKQPATAHYAASILTHPHYLRPTHTGVTMQLKGPLLEHCLHGRCLALCSTQQMVQSKQPHMLYTPTLEPI